MRDYVSYYAQKIDVLRKRKIILLKIFFFNKNKIRKNFNRRISIQNSSKTKWNSYQQLQSFFNRLNWLIYQNFNRVFYVDINESRKSFEIMIYHLKNDKNIQYLSNDELIINHLRKSFQIVDNNFFLIIENFSQTRLKNISKTLLLSKRKNVEFIIFFNRILISIEKKYWSIELKMTKLIWLIKQIRHMIKTSKYIIIIYIDHVVNSSIIRQIKFINNNVDKLNIKLIRVSIYLSQFWLNVRYKSKKSHIILDAFNHLSTRNIIFNDKNNVLDIENFHNDMINSKNNDIYVFNKNLITIFDDFKRRLKIIIKKIKYKSKFWLC